MQSGNVDFVFEVFEGIIYKPHLMNELVLNNSSFCILTDILLQ